MDGFLHYDIHPSFFFFIELCFWSILDDQLKGAYVMDLQLSQASRSPHPQISRWKIWIGRCLILLTFSRV